MTAEPPTGTSRPRLDRIAWAWFALSAIWAVVLIVTDQLAWPLALWIATTLGPLTWFRTQRQRTIPTNPAPSQGMNP